MRPTLSLGANVIGCLLLGLISKFAACTSHKTSLILGLVDLVVVALAVPPVVPPVVPPRD